LVDDNSSIQKQLTDLKDKIKIT